MVLPHLLAFTESDVVPHYSSTPPCHRISNLGGILISLYPKESIHRRTLKLEF